MYLFYVNAFAFILTNKYDMHRRWRQLSQRLFLRRMNSYELMGNHQTRVCVQTEDSPPILLPGLIDLLHSRLLRDDNV